MQVIPGEKYGRLTAIRPSEQRGYWFFECVCGQVVERKVENISASLNQGHKPCCNVGNCRGNRIPIVPDPKRLQITGQKFGRLLAIESTGKVDSKRYTIWRFRCECGRVVERSAGYVVNDAKRGRIPSCGRFSCNNRPKLPYGRAARNKLILVYRQNARKRGLVFDLGDEELDFLFKGNCHYCGVPPYQVVDSGIKSNTGTFLYNGIDRIDNSIGYVTGNVVSCCEKCNHAKATMGYQEFIEWIDRLVSFRVWSD